MRVDWSKREKSRILRNNERKKKKVKETDLKCDYAYRCGLEGKMSQESNEKIKIDMPLISIESKVNKKNIHAIKVRTHSATEIKNEV